MAKINYLDDYVGIVNESHNASYPEDVKLHGYPNILNKAKHLHYPVTGLRTENRIEGAGIVDEAIVGTALVG